MKILMVGQRGVPATFGGVERHVEELGSRLVQRGHEVIVFCRSNYTESGLTEHRGMQLIRVPAVSSKHLDAIVSSAIATAKTMVTKADIVHFHAVGPGAFSFVPRYLSRKHVVQTIHGLDGDRAKWGPLARTFLRSATWLSSRVPNETIVVSQSLGEHYHQRYGRKATYIPNGVTAPSPRPPGPALERFGLTKGRYILYVGRLVPEKCSDLLVDAFRSIDTDFRLVIAGGSSFSDDYIDRVKALARDDDRVILTDYVYGDDLAEIYTNAGLFVLPSALEGLPLTLLEAIGAELPVVASDIPPHVEVLTDTKPGGRLFASGNKQALQAQLTAALGDLSGETAAANSRRDRIMAEYDWEIVTDQLEATYRRVSGL